MSEKSLAEELRALADLDSNSRLSERLYALAARLTAALERRNAEIEKVADEIWSDRHNIGVIAARWSAALRRIVRGE